MGGYDIFNTITHKIMYKNIYMLMLGRQISQLCHPEGGSDTVYSRNTCMAVVRWRYVVFLSIAVK